MRKTGLLMMISLWVCSSVWAETWTLTDEETGEVFGPLAPRSGAVVNVGDRTLTLKVSNTKKDRTEARLKSIIIPNVEFRQANVKDVLNFLVEVSIAEDPEGEGTSIVLSQISGAPLPTQSKPSVDGGWGFEAAEWGEPGGVTLNLRRVSIYDTISIIAETAGLEWRVDESGVVIVKKKDLP